MYVCFPRDIRLRPVLQEVTGCSRCHVAYCILVITIHIYRVYLYVSLRTDALSCALRRNSLKFL